MKTDFDKLFRTEMDRLDRQRQSRKVDQQHYSDKDTEQRRIQRNRELDRTLGQRVDRYA